MDFNRKNAENNRKKRRTSFNLKLCGETNFLGRSSFCFGGGGGNCFSWVANWDVRVELESFESRKSQ